MHKIIPNLWFDQQAEEAAQFYTSIFNNSKVGKITHYGDAGAEVSGQPKGSVMTVEFILNGQYFVAINGGKSFTFSPAISLEVMCKTQEEIDRFWDKLGQGGKIQQCGWLEDKYGVSWQIVPEVLREMIQDKDPVKAERVMQAMLQMKKLDIKALQQAYQQSAQEKV